MQNLSRFSAIRGQVIGLGLGPALALTLAACGRFEPIQTTDAANPPLDQTSVAEPADTVELVPSEGDPTPVQEPPLPEKANPLIAGYMSLNEIASSLPFIEYRNQQANVVTDLQKCFNALGSTGLVYDGIPSAPLVPNAEHSNVEGDVIIQNANIVDVKYVDGIVTVERAEWVRAAVGFNAPLPAHHSFIARLISELKFIDGSVFANTLALRETYALKGGLILATHAAGVVRLDQTPASQTTPSKLSCIAAQEIGSIDTYTGTLALLGRGEGGDSANLGSIYAVDGSIFAIGIDIGSISNVETLPGQPLYFEQSYIRSISGKFGEAIYLNASKVDSLTSNSKNTINVYLVNGAEVASTGGAVNLIKVN